MRAMLSAQLLQVSQDRPDLKAEMLIRLQSIGDDDVQSMGLDGYGWLNLLFIAVNYSID